MFTRKTDKRVKAFSLIRDNTAVTQGKPIVILRRKLKLVVEQESKHSVAKYFKMACEKRPYLCGILVLCTLALFFHLAGFVTPGWLIMRLSLTEETRQTSIFEAKLIDNGGVNPPPEDEKPVEKLINLRKRRSEEDLEIIEADVVKENEVLEEWIMETTIEIKTFDVSTSYGLWYSTVCVHDKNKRDHDSAEKHKDEDSSSSSEDDDDKKGHCRCRKVSTKCALYNSFIYEDPIDYINPGPPAKRVLSNKNFGYASLAEHRVENCVALGFLVMGLISAIVGFRRVDSCRCAATACVIFMLLAAFVAIVPVARLSHYSVYKHSQGIPVKVHAPYSVIATGLGAFFALITALVAGCALMKKSQKQKPGKWYQFNNELELPSEKEKKPSLVFITEPLPEKTGLNDALKLVDGDFDEVELEKEAVA